MEATSDPPIALPVSCPAPGSVKQAIIHQGDPARPALAAVRTLVSETRDHRRDGRYPSLSGAARRRELQLLVSQAIIHADERTKTAIRSIGHYGKLTAEAMLDANNISEVASDRLKSVIDNLTSEYLSRADDLFRQVDRELPGTRPEESK